MTNKWGITTICITYNYKLPGFVVITDWCTRQAGQWYFSNLSRWDHGRRRSRFGFGGGFGDAGVAGRWWSSQWPARGRSAERRGHGSTDGYVSWMLLMALWKIFFSWNFAPQEGCLKSNPGAWDDNFKLYWLAGLWLWEMSREQWAKH